MIPPFGIEAGAPEKSRYRLDLAWAPFLGKERLQRTIEAQYRGPAFAGHGLNPVARLNAVGLFGAKVDCHGAIVVRFGGGRRIALTAGAWITLRSVEHRARLVVVDS